MCGDELEGEDAAVLDPDDECQCLSSSPAVKKPSSDSEVQDSCVAKEESEIERDRGSDDDDDAVVVVVVDDIDEEEDMDALDVKESSAPICAAVVQASSSPCSTTSARACGSGTYASSSAPADVPVM